MMKLNVKIDTQLKKEDISVDIVCKRESSDLFCAIISSKQLKLHDKKIYGADTGNSIDCAVRFLLKLMKENE